MLSVVCIKVGDKYPSEYVNKLHNMVSRNLHVDHEFICITDDNKDVECKTLEVEDDLPGWWSKLTLFKKRAYGLEKVLFFDLDVVITGNLDAFANYNSDFAIIRDWWYPSYNSSVFLLEVGSRRKVWDKFIKDKDRIMRNLHGDQDWITKHAKADLWPEGWCTSYKTTPYPVGLVSVFHGEPNPHQVDDEWVKDLWK